MPQRMRRRRAVQGLGLAGLLLLPGCGRLPAQAPQAPRFARIGFLTPTDAVAANAEAFRHALADHGYVEGRNIEIIWRDGDGQVEQMARMADELARLPVDLIVAEGNAATDAARHATSAIPIVMVRASDPVGGGIV